MFKASAFIVTSLISFLAFDVMAAIPGSVQPCSMDSYNSDRILENVPTAERVDVFNGEGEIVGAFQQDPATTEVHALYLCGNNSGYYYAEGNVRERVIHSIYNDEYESDVKSKEIRGHLKISISIRFTGEEEDADYGPVNAEIFIKLP